MSEPVELSSSQEDYLEAILELTEQGGVARVGEIAERVGVAKSSVTVALRALSRQELVNYEPYQFVTLRDRGRQAARKISRRHQALRLFLTDVLGVDPATAETNACRIEHAVEDAVMQRLNCFMEFLSQSRVPAQDLPAAFAGWCMASPAAQACSRTQCKGCQSEDTE